MSRNNEKSILKNVIFLKKCITFEKMRKSNFKRKENY